MSMQDRGTKKWTSLMLPEHVEMLKQVFAETSYQEKPMLDEQQKMKIDRELSDALNRGGSVEITVYQNHRLDKVSGKPVYVDKGSGYLRINDSNNPEIPLANIVDIEMTFGSELE
ncbi:YolD-like family protein [Virgibacillus sp. W0181]|uniref:YolD-like family protein n=1 Tax=Virgibacillus sp. W0181 TaxID=3391581 RepID=UPI003F467685